MTGDDLFPEAQRLHREGRLPEAEALYRKILASDTTHADALHFLGALHMQQDRFDEAESAIRRSLELKPREATALVNLGTLLLRRQREAEALASFRAALSIDPFRSTAHIGLAEAQRALGKSEAAVLSARKAVAIDPRNAEACTILGLTLQDSGQGGVALEWLQKASDLQPGHARFRYNLGAVLQSLGQDETAVEAYRRALSINPGLSEAHNNLGVLLLEQGNPLGAVTHFTLASELTAEMAPRLPAIRNNLGKALSQVGRFDEAMACFRSVLEMDPLHAEAMVNLGATERSLGRYQASEATLRQAILERPDMAEAHNNLGLTLRDLGLLDEARSSIERSRDLRPDLPEVHVNLGLVLNGYGRNDEALASLRHAAALRPDSAAVQRSVLGVMIYCAVPGSEQFAENRRFARLAKSGPRTAPRHVGAPDPDRRLRIGYLSSDFSTHPVTQNMLPVLEHRDRVGTEVFAYADVIAPTGRTEQVRGLVNHWRSITGMSDSDVAEMIHGDHIDILVLLAGRFDRNRPQLAAYRAAPLQVSFHDPATSGFTEMDYIIADRTLVPRGARERFSERVVRLPSFYIHDPIAAPETSPLPAEKAGFVTFGIVNNPAKLSDTSLRLFARVAAAVPRSRLFFKFRDFYRSQALCDRVTRIVTQEGVDVERIVIARRNVSDASHLEVFAGCDIALDTTPFNGSTTTFELLWMGVPVVTLLGDSMIARWSAAMLKPLKLEELVADSPAGFIERAAGLAGDFARLAALRAGMRARLAASPLCNGQGRARQLDRLYRALWRRWCAGRRQGS